MSPRSIACLLPWALSLVGCTRTHGRLDTSEMGRPWPRSGSACEHADTLRVDPLVTDSSAAEAFAWGPGFQPDAWGWRRWQAWASEGGSTIPFASLPEHGWSLRIAHTVDQCHPDQAHLVRHEVLRDGVVHQTETFPHDADVCPLAFRWWGRDPDAVGGRGNGQEPFRVLARFRNLSFLSSPPPGLPPSRRAAWLRQTWRTEARFQVRIESGSGNFPLDLGGGL